MFYRLIIRLNNFFFRRRKPCVLSDQVLLLLPNCLQREKCSIKLSADLEACKRCGQCNIGALLDLRDELGIRCRMATGGRQALEMTRDKAVRVVVAVACEKELFEGIRAAFPKPVLAISNRRPNGPCLDTQVDIEQVRAAVLGLIQA